MFISYVREDSARIDWLQQILEQADLRVWRDTAQQANSYAAKFLTATFEISPSGGGIPWQRADWTTMSSRDTRAHAIACPGSPRASPKPSRGLTR